MQSNLTTKPRFVKGKKNRDKGLISPTCLCAAFTLADPKSAKRQSSHQCLFSLLGTEGTKAASKAVGKIDKKG